ncbi:hypothetical protein EPYR_03917 [Erwinia pyrifoliae DSM 12163]|nr:hypothetical protein EPYR_03917 [Erwinia pyrifoliae DSM 12163]
MFLTIKWSHCSKEYTKAGQRGKGVGYFLKACLRLSSEISAVSDSTIVDRTTC